MPNGTKENQGKFGAVGVPLEIITDQIPSTSYECDRLGQLALPCSAMEIMKESQEKLGQAENVADIEVMQKKMKL